MEPTENRPGRRLMIHRNLVIARLVSLANTPSNCETIRLEPSHPRTSAADSKERTAADRMEHGRGIREGGAEGATRVRLCTLGAQGGELAWEEFEWEVERNLNGKESEACEILYFKANESQFPVSKQALRIAARMLGSNKSRGYCLEMIRSDFLSGFCNAF